MENWKKLLEELEKRVVALNEQAGRIEFTAESVVDAMDGTLDEDAAIQLRTMLSGYVVSDYKKVIADYFAIFRQNAKESINSDELFDMTVAIVNGENGELANLCPNLDALLSDYFSMLGIYEDDFSVSRGELTFVKGDILESMEEVYHDFLVALRGSRLKFKFELYKDFKGYKLAVFEKPVEYTKLSDGDYLLTIPVTPTFFGESGLLASFVMVERFLLEVTEGLGIGSSLRFPSFSVADEIGDFFEFLEESDIEVDCALEVDTDGVQDVYEVLVDDEVIGAFTEFQDLKRVRDILSSELSENVLPSVMKRILEKRYGVDEFFTNSREEW